MRFVRTLYAASVLFFLAGAPCSAQGSVAPPDDSHRAECVRLIERHVHATRGWDKSLYRVQREDAGNEHLGFAVIYLEEERTPLYMGERRSFHVDLNHGCTRVMGELRYQ